MGLKKLTAAAAAIVFTLGLAAPALAEAPANSGDSGTEIAVTEHGGTEMALDLGRAADAPETGEEAPDGEEAPSDVLTFEPSSIDVLIVSAFNEGETVVPMYLGGGIVMRTHADGSTDYVSEGVSYAWYESDEHGALKGEPISDEEFLFNNGQLSYDPHKAGIHLYKEVVSVDGEEIGSQLFILIVVGTGLRFDITAPTDTVAAGPVTLTAQIPDDFDTQVANLKNLLPELADEELFLERTMTYWGGGAQLETTEGASADNKPTLTVAPFTSSAGYADLRFIVEYNMNLGGHYGAVRMYSNPFRLQAADPQDSPGGASSRFFEAAPLSETELRELYATLIAPYHDDTKTDPFALAPAQTDATGALTAASQNELFGLINFIRRCAGVDPLTSLDARKSGFAQAGARYMSDNELFGHAVAEGKDPDAHEGLMRSNLSSGWWNNGDPYDFIKLQLDQFYDNSAKTMPAMEHRQMLLDNRLISTGLGYMGPTQANKRTYLVTHVDGSELRTTQPKSLEAFPGAGAFPVELMNFKGWTLTLGNNWTVPNHTELAVTVTRDDGESWVLSQLDDPTKAYEATGDWFCCADKGEVGSGATILFAPGSIFEGGDYKNTDSLKGHTFTVSIQGIVDEHGEDVSLVEYTTEFISLLDDPADPTPSAQPSASAAPSPGTDPTDEPSPGTDPTAEPSATPSTRPAPSATDLSGMKIETIDGTDYVTGILASTSTNSVGAMLEQAMTVIEHDPDTTCRVVASAEDLTPLAADAVIGTGRVLQMISGSGDILLSAPVVICGDVSGSGRVDIAQLSTLARHLTGSRVLEGARLLAGDINGNGHIDIADLSKMAEMLVRGS